MRCTRMAGIEKHVFTYFKYYSMLEEKNYLISFHFHMSLNGLSSRDLTDWRLFKWNTSSKTYSHHSRNMVRQTKEEVNWREGSCFQTKNHIIIQITFSVQSYLKECNYDGPHHDIGRVEDNPENERDRQATCFCILLYVCEGSEVKDKSRGVEIGL